MLAYCGIDAAAAHAAGALHVQFDGAEAMKASVPIQKAVSPWGDCLLAYEMNGAPVPRDHGGVVNIVYQYRPCIQCNRVVPGQYTHSVIQRRSTPA